MSENVYTLLVDGVRVPMTPEQIAVWQAEESVPKPPPGPQELIFFTGQIISQGQLAMAGDPLPVDLQKQVYDLEVFVANYLRRNAKTLALAVIDAFVIPEEREDVDENQRQLVENLKAELMAVISG